MVLPLAGTAAVAILAAGCGGSSPSAATRPKSTTPPAVAAPTTALGGVGATATTAPTAVPSTTSPSTTTPPLTTTLPTGPQPCTTGQLALTLSGQNGAAGSTYVTLDLRNTAASACTLNGYPGVSYVGGGNGTQIGASAARDPSTPIATITVGAGQSAQSELRLIDPYVFDSAACNLQPTQGFRVYPPGQTTAAFVNDPGEACSSTTLPQPALFVGAVRAG